MGAIFALTRFSFVRISIRDLVADGKSLVRNSGVGGGGQNRILKPHPRPPHIVKKKNKMETKTTQLQKEPPQKTKLSFENMLGWHACRATLRQEFSHEKCSEMFSEILEPFFCGSKTSRKMSAKFPTNFPSQISKITNELLRERREKNMWLKIVYMCVSAWF